MLQRFSSGCGAFGRCAAAAPHHCGPSLASDCPALAMNISRSGGAAGGRIATSSSSRKKGACGAVGLGGLMRPVVVPAAASRRRRRPAAAPQAPQAPAAAAAPHHHRSHPRRPPGTSRRPDAPARHRRPPAATGAADRPPAAAPLHPLRPVVVRAVRVPVRPVVVRQLLEPRGLVDDVVEVVEEHLPHLRAYFTCGGRMFMIRKRRASLGAGGCGRCRVEQRAGLRGLAKRERA